MLHSIFKSEPLAYYRIHKNNFSSIKINLYKNELSKWISVNEKNFLLKNYKITNQKILLYKLKLKHFVEFFKKFLGV